MGKRRAPPLHIPSWRTRWYSGRGVRWRLVAAAPGDVPLPYAWTLNMEYNLTQRERQLLIDLLKLSNNSKAGFEARVDVNAEGPARELAQLDFRLAGNVMELTKRDLRVLKDEGLILFRWHKPDRGIGRLTSLAFEAVGS